MSRILKRVFAIYVIVEKICGRIAGGLIMVLMLLTAADVAGRFLFNSPILGAYEISEILMVGIVFLGIAYVQSNKGHVIIEVVTVRMPEKGKIALDTLGYTIGFLMMVLITWDSGGYALKAFITHDYSSGLAKIPLWPGKSLVPLGAGLISLRLLSDIVFNIRRLVNYNQVIKEN
jgi:TRAP-type C4-dicarboxylate transport system permease small subunit